MVLWELQIKKKLLQQHAEIIGKLNGSNEKIGKNTSTKLPLPILHTTHGWYGAPEKTSLKTLESESADQLRSKRVSRPNPKYYGPDWQHKQVGS
jgi:hypothetical protein